MLASQLQIIGEICVQYNLPAGDPCWMAAMIGTYLVKPPLPGDFRFCSSWDTEMFDDAYKAITKANKWKFMKDYNPSSFMLAQHPDLDEINRNITYGHSGSTYGATMRHMQQIAKQGWWSYVKHTFPT